VRSDISRATRVIVDTTIESKKELERLRAIRYGTRGAPLWNSGVVTLCSLMPSRAGSPLAIRAGMNPDVNAEPIVTEILATAGARECGRCGKQSSVPARNDSGRERQLWFCFECGNEEVPASALRAV
jgi:hypothetical protein